jgi:hypothetical protein
MHPLTKLFILIEYNLQLHSQFTKKGEENNAANYRPI